MSVVSEDRFASGFRWEDYMRKSEKNLERFNENYDKFALDPEDAGFFAGVTAPLKVLILAEDWCGDVVQSLPPIVRMLEQSPSIAYRIFRRDENLDVMDRYLTDGSRAIPYLVFMDDGLNELARWGPRPDECQAIMRDNKGRIPMEDIYPRIRSWYRQHGNGPLVTEIRGVLERIKRTA